MHGSPIVVLLFLFGNKAASFYIPLFSKKALCLKFVYELAKALLVVFTLRFPILISQHYEKLHGRSCLGLVSVDNFRCFNLKNRRHELNRNCSPPAVSDIGRKMRISDCCSYVTFEF